MRREGIAVPKRVAVALVMTIVFTLGVVFRVWGPGGSWPNWSRQSASALHHLVAGEPSVPLADAILPD